MKYLVNFIRLIVGLVFIFSGFVKLVDPMGLAFKLEEYFSPAVFNLSVFMDFTLPIAVCLIILEVMLGFFLLLGVYKKFTILSLWVLMILFTFLTFYSAYYDKVTDCGCFGDAIKLTPWQSFYKDMILLGMVLVLTIGRKYIQPIMSKKYYLPILFIIFIWSCFIAYKGINSSPLIDFRPYAEGENIKEGMRTAEDLGLEGDQYQVTYQLKNTKTGKTIEISDDEYVNNETYWAEQTPWLIENTDRKLIKKGYQPKIKDFVIDCGEEGILTEKYLDQGYLVVFVSYKKDGRSQAGIEKLNALYPELKKMEIDVVGLFADENPANVSFPVCKTDATTIKTMIRSNPGVLLLHKGVVLKKYHWRDLPSSQSIVDNFTGKVVDR